MESISVLGAGFWDPACKMWGLEEGELERGDALRAGKVDRSDQVECCVM
jgi:hypothetical protein